MHVRQLVSLKGRATRRQFVFVQLVVLALTFFALFLKYWLAYGGSETAMDSAVRVVLFVSLGVAFWLGFAAIVRRLHDLNYSGWWSLLCSIPAVGAIATLALCFLPPASESRFGPTPRDARNGVPHTA